MFAKAITALEPEHRRMLRANAFEFLGARPSSRIRALAEARGFDAESFAQMAELGWVGLMFSGSELDASDMVALHRELGRRVAPEPVLASGVLAAGILGEAANPAFEGRLEAINAGKTVATLAWQGAAGAVDATGCGARARRVAGGWTLDGTLHFVPWASRADAIVVAAIADGGVILGWLQPGGSGVAMRSGAGVDRTEFGTVVLQDVHLADDAAIAGPDRGAEILDRVLDLGRLAVSAELVGAAEAAFEMTLDYLRQRKQFGRAIGSNQALQFAGADLFVQIELSNSVLANAARQFAEAGEGRARLVAGCKARCGDAAFLAVRQAIQLHGAIGYTHECDVSLYVRRVMQLNAWLGNPARQRQRIGLALMGERRTAA